MQMIGDPARGSAWTRALLGLPAAEIHLCGDASALGLVRRMCKDTGEELTVREWRTGQCLYVGEYESISGWDAGLGGEDRVWVQDMEGGGSV